MMTRYFLKLIYSMPNTKLDLQWLEQMEKPWRKKKKKERLEQPHLRPRGCEIRRLSNEDGMEPWALTQEKMKGL